MTDSTAPDLAPNDIERADAGGHDPEATEELDDESVPEPNPADPSDAADEPTEA